MKKYIWLGSITGVLLLAVGLVGGLLHEEPVEVRVRHLKTEGIQQTVLCTGRVEEAGRDVLAVSASGTKVQVRVAVPENHLRFVREGQRVVVSGTAFHEESYNGTVVSLGEEAYTSSTGGTVVDAVVALEGADASLKCGLTAKANIAVRYSEGLLLPYSSLCADEEGKEYVYVLENTRAVRREVTVQEELAQGVLVAGGVQAGERLIEEPEKIKSEGVLVKEAA